MNDDEGIDFTVNLVCIWLGIWTQMKRVTLVLAFRHCSDSFFYKVILPVSNQQSR